MDGIKEPQLLSLGEALLERGKYEDGALEYIVFKLGLSVIRKSRVTALCQAQEQDLEETHL